MSNAPKHAVSNKSSNPSPSEGNSYHTIAPYIVVPRAAEFIEFLKACFEGKERFRVGQPDAPGRIMHAEVTVGDSMIELADANEAYPPAPTAIHLYLDDADAGYARAINAGATSI